VLFCILLNFRLDDAQWNMKWVPTGQSLSSDTCYNISGGLYIYFGCLGDCL
jgi:hypothetical protein